jgi:hypothetical protein
MRKIRYEKITIPVDHPIITWKAPLQCLFTQSEIVSSNSIVRSNSVKSIKKQRKLAKDVYQGFKNINF